MPRAPPGDNTNTPSTPRVAQFQGSLSSLDSMITQHSNGPSLSSHVRRCADQRQYKAGVRRKHRMYGVAPQRRRTNTVHMMQHLENSDSEDEIRNVQQPTTDESSNRTHSDIRDRHIRNIHDDTDRFHLPGFRNKRHHDSRYAFNHTRRNTRSTLKLARKICVRDRNSVPSSTTDDVVEGDSSTLSSWRRVDLATHHRDIQLPLTDRTGFHWLRPEQDETLCQGGSSRENDDSVMRNRARREAIPGIGELTLVLESAYPRQAAPLGAEELDWDTRSSVSV